MLVAGIVLIIASIVVYLAAAIQTGGIDTESGVFHSASGDDSKQVTGWRRSAVALAYLGVAVGVVLIIVGAVS